DVGADHGHAAEPVGDRHVAAVVDSGPRRAPAAVGTDHVAAELDAGDGVDLRDRALAGIGDPDEALDVAAAGLAGISIAVTARITVAVAGRIGVAALVRALIEGVAEGRERADPVAVAPRRAAIVSARAEQRDHTNARQRDDPML